MHVNCATVPAERTPTTTVRPAPPRGPATWTWSSSGSRIFPLESGHGFGEGQTSLEALRGELDGTEQPAPPVACRRDVGPQSARRTWRITADGSGACQDGNGPLVLRPIPAPRRERHAELSGSWKPDGLLAGEPTRRPVAQAAGCGGWISRILHGIRSVLDRREMTAKSHRATWIHHRLFLSPGLLAEPPTRVRFPNGKRP